MNWLWLTGIVIVLDQLTKQVAERNLELYRPHAYIEGHFNFMLAYNEGAAFSFLSDAGGWQRWFFTVLSSAISVVLFIWLRRIADENRILACALALILGGAIGNLIDRVIYGHVIDFLQFYYQADSCLIGFSEVTRLGVTNCYWPAFNIADAAIFLGAACLIIDMFRGEKHE